ncbi:MAG: hypothetical protein LDL41_07890 [Coleofasciculus sp. S288]|nr:hypothetical protein [Coleofasciculus sp. S288]
MTSAEQREEAIVPRSLETAKLSAYGLSALAVGAFLLLPLVNLFHPSPWQRTLGFVHGMAAMLAVIVITYAGHLAFPLLRGAQLVLPKTQKLAFAASVLAFISVATGNAAYARYRAPLNGARAFLTEHSPLVHWVYMEAHEFMVLFTVPLGVAVSWILWRYYDAIFTPQNRPVLAATSIALMAMMLYGIIGFVTGLSIAKVHAL